MKAAQEAKELKISISYLGCEIVCFINIIKSYSEACNHLKAKILVLHKEIPNLEQNVTLLCTHPEVGFMSAVSLLAEIGDIHNFKNAKKVVAFLEVDTYVSQLGDFNSTHNTLTKRGSRLVRKILFNIDIGSIKTQRNGIPSNPVLLAYYKKLIESKPKKVAICAVMHKLINHFFVILRNQKTFELRLLETHKQLYLINHLTLVV